MVRFKLLITYTEIGVSQIQNTVARAAAFRHDAAAMGVTVEDVCWTLGAFDGVLTLSAAEEEKVIALVTDLARKGYVRTQLLRAFTKGEFEHILEMMPSATVDLDVLKKAPSRAPPRSHWFRPIPPPPFPEPFHSTGRNTI